MKDEWKNGPKALAWDHERKCWVVADEYKQPLDKDEILKGDGFVCLTPKEVLLTEF